MPVRAKGRCSVMYVVITILWYLTNKVLHLVCACKIEGELLLVKQETIALHLLSCKRCREVTFSLELEGNFLPLGL